MFPNKINPDRDDNIKQTSTMALEESLKTFRKKKKRARALGILNRETTLVIKLRK